MTARRLLAPLLTVAALLVGVLGPASQASSGPRLAVHDNGSTYQVGNGAISVSIEKNPWRLSLLNGVGTTVAQEQDPTLPNMGTNLAMQINKNFDGRGHDKAYPGLPVVSTRPLSYLRDGTWSRVTRFIRARTKAQKVTIDVATSDGGVGVVTLSFRAAAVDLTFTPNGPAASATAESFTKSPLEHVYGGGGRFLKTELTGLSVPLWVSHGIGADETVFTNEIAVPYISSTAGWAMFERSGARGVFAVGVPERPTVTSSIIEHPSVELTLYVGTLQSMLSAFTVDQGVPPVPPQWAFTPQWWDDNQNTQKEVLANVATLKKEGIPVGAYWIDNPFQKYQGDFSASKDRFPNWAGFVRTLHNQGVRLITWVSPFYDSRSYTAKLGAKQLLPNPADGNDHTYWPARGINDHVDLTDPTSYAAEVRAATGLLRSGVDGFKLDRSEEDFGDGVRFASGVPNRLGHSQYVLLYDKAMREACDAAHPDGSCLLMARGGVAGSSHYVGNWAGDTLMVESVPGMLSAIHSLLSEAMSGQPIWASDVGGYSGDPTAATFVRWAQFGAVSPIMESPHHPSNYSAQSIEAIRKAAVLHQRLAPYTYAAAKRASKVGVPIAQPLVLAYPDDAVAPLVDDEYLFDGCLLAAPIHTGIEVEGPAARPVYLPAGSWTNVFTGTKLTGPISKVEVSSYDEFPLYRSSTCNIPMSVFKNL